MTTVLIPKSVPFTVAEFNKGPSRQSNTRVPSYQAFLEYGNDGRMLKFSEAFPLFGIDREWKQHKGILQPVLPIWVAMVAGLSRKPLCETIQTDSIGSFLANPLDESSERLYFPKNFDSSKTGENANFRGVLLAEQGVYLDMRDGHYSYYVSDAKDLRLMPIYPFNGWISTDKCPALFGSIKGVKAYLWFPRDDVRVGLVSVGDGGIYSYFQGVGVPAKSSHNRGVLIREIPYSQV